MIIKLIFIKRITIACYLWVSFISFAFSQKNGEHVDGGRFIKRIEYNLMDIQLVKKVGHNFIVSGYRCHLGSKSDVEKLFFGDFNAPVEFFYAPSFEASTKGEAGFRIVRDSLDISFILEIKYIPNYEEVYRKSSERPTYYQLPQLTGISECLIDSIPFEIRAILLDHIKAKREEERFKFFKVETVSFPVSDQFAEKLYQKMVSLIDRFKAKGISSIIMDGYTVSFRNVVDDEVWSLEIHMPEGNALKMADLCRQIITDAIANELDEEEYLYILNEFD
jgi:hypothetical protein